MRTCSSSSCLRRSSLAAVLLALAFPAAASAHASLVGSKPADGAVLATPPAAVRLLFDDEVRPAAGARAVDAAGRSVLAGPERLQGSRVVVLPLRSGLARGAYTVRWRVVSDDGHRIEGVLAFAVGAGSPRPVATLTAGGGTSTAAILFKLLFLAGVVVAGGSALTRRFLDADEIVPAFAGFVLLAAGGAGLLLREPAAEATRFGRVTEAAVAVALAGASAAVVSLVMPRLRPLVSALAVLELAAPTLSGHALDPQRLRALVAVADLAHVAAAAVWVGGLVLLVAARGRRERFHGVALGALAVLGAAGVSRALAAFPSVGDVVHTGYGQALLVKTGLLAGVLAVVWANRRRIATLGLGLELLVLAGVVAAAAVLSEVRPPERAAAAVAVAVRAKPAPPPPSAVVLARQDDDVAVGLALSPRGRRIAARVTALGPDGDGIDGLRVRIGGLDARPCGAGCYAATVPVGRRIDVELDGRTLDFALPKRWPAPAAAAVLTRVDRAFRRLRSLVVHEHLASSARNALDTVYRLEAPNRMAYDIAGGPDAIVIGSTRWDRDRPGAAWTRSKQEPLRQPEPFWGSDPRANAHLLGPGRLSFYDPRPPAWFELTFEPRTGRLLRLRMTAQAHFMRHRYSGFDRPLRIFPPPP